MATKSSTLKSQKPAQPTMDLNGPSIGAIQPNLTVTNVAEAIEFYTRLGFRTQLTMPGPTGEPTFGILNIGNTLVHIVGADGPHPDPKRAKQIKDGPRGLGVIFYTQVPDVDATHKLLVKNKVRVFEAPKDQFWGDRTVVCIDPYGYEWTFFTHVRDVSPEEMAKAAAAQSG